MEDNINIPLVSEMHASGKSPEIVFWVGCAGSFDARAQKVTEAFVKILNAADIDFAILGNEESCTGDPARRAGNEFIFQMTAMQNIQTLNMYEVKKIVTTCPHCFNILRNEYPELGGNYKVIHHTQFLADLIRNGKIKIKEGTLEKITYHDSCYLGRANGIYEAPREIISALNGDIIEMKRNKSKGLCCGAGGAQMFKEDEQGDKRINIERMEEAIKTGAEIVAVNCPFCLTMMQDGAASLEGKKKIMVYDLAELIIQNER